MPALPVRPSHWGKEVVLGKEQGRGVFPTRLPRRQSHEKFSLVNADEEDPIGSKHVQHFQLACKNKGFLNKCTYKSLQN